MEFGDNCVGMRRIALKTFDVRLQETRISISRLERHRTRTRLTTVGEKFLFQKTAGSVSITSRAGTAACGHWYGDSLKPLAGKDFDSRN